MQFTNIRRDEDVRNPAGVGEPDHDAWTRIPSVSLDPRHLARHRVVTLGRHDPAHVAFDLLRTRLVQALKARGWSRVAITSPSKACGKTFVAANLALSLARRPSCRAVLMDLDLRIPNLARVLGIRDTATTADFLAGRCPPEALLRRVAPNLAVGANGTPSSDSAELIQEPTTTTALEGLRKAFRPDVILYDLPPTLACDDVIAFLPQVDGVLLVAAGGTTSADEVRECERLLTGQAPLLGVILNKAEDPAIEPYYS
jgi:Mrp family chromosome partitioning ATPase